MGGFVRGAAGRPASGRHIEVLSAVLPPGITSYRPPSWLKEKAGAGPLHWRVVALDGLGATLRETPWRGLTLQ